jgi:diguanylate cyclase (GGDEF)-like protein/PAS domain S-box-containing protein
MNARARTVIAIAVLAAAGCVALLVERFSAAGLGQLWIVTVFALFVLASWLWPIVMYQGSSSQAHHLDEGLFVLLALTLPPLGVVVAFSTATAVAQCVRRRPFTKSTFNVAQMLLSVSAGIAVMHAIAPPGPKLTWTELGVAVLGALVYFAVNSVSVTAVLASIGADRFSRLLIDGLEIRTLLLGAAVSFGLVAAMAVSMYDQAVVLVGLPFWAFRQTLAGHYRARHDRTRLRGLFEATLEVNRHMGPEEVTDALAGAASDLLRSPEVAVLSTGVPEHALAAPMSVHGNERWLVVSGRSRAEPFDDADRALLDALAAVGSGALENAYLYEERRDEQERLIALTSSLGEGVCAFDLDGRITFLNPAAEELLGCRADEVVGQLAAASDAELAILSAPARTVIETGRTARSDRGTTFRRRGGAAFPVEYTCSPIRSQGGVTGAVIAFRDISDHVAFEQQLTYHAFHDALTNLPNRRLFLDRLQHAIERANRSGEVHAVLFIDVDRFKVANDSLGHQAGDQLLIEIARRLSTVAREGDTFARFGGDEFTLLVEDITDHEEAERVATRLLEVTREPIVLEGGRTVALSISVGVALTSATSTPDDVLHDSDVAMYQAKHRGTGQYQLYDAKAMDTRSAHWVDLEVELRRAIEHRELSVYYQPEFATATRRIVGAEALVRWPHPERGLLGPDAFIGLAEETGLILPLGRFVLEEATRQAVEWSELIGAPFSMAVNLSVRQFQAAELVDEIHDVVVQSSIIPSQLCLEITESLAHLDITRSIEILTGLRALGVRLAIDDFGTGYSSLSHLKQFPIDVVKLDGSFVQDLDRSTMDTAIVAAVVDLAKLTGITAIAEGVETSDQLERLAQMGCPVVQGYYLARPMTASELTRTLPEQFDGTSAINVGLAVATEEIARGA